MTVLEFSLPAIAPFRLDFTVWALRRRDRNIIDYWNGTKYIRVFTLENSPVKVQVEQNGIEPQIFVTATSKYPILKLKAKVSNLLNHMLGLQINLNWFYDLTKNDKLLHPLIIKFLGVKPPRFPTIFEALSNAISCQQVSLESGLSIQNNLIKQYGMQFKENDQVYYAFPEPREMKNYTYNDLMKLGFSHRKSDTLIEVATKICDNEKIFTNVENASNEDIIKLFTSFKGIGLWSAEYVLLRGLGRTEILPGDDVSVQKNITRIFNLNKKPEAGNKHTEKTTTAQNGKTDKKQVNSKTEVKEKAAAATNEKKPDYSWMLWLAGIVVGLLILLFLYHKISAGTFLSGLFKRK